MSLASASARFPSPRRTPQGAANGQARPFAQVEVCETLEDARLPWASLAQETPASPYQSFDFARIWFATIGAAQRMTPLIVVARDNIGQPVALLPFARTARWPLRFAVFSAARIRTSTSASSVRTARGRATTSPRCSPRRRPRRRRGSTRSCS